MKTHSILRATAWLYVLPRALAVALILTVLGLASFLLLIQFGLVALRSVIP